MQCTTSRIQRLKFLGDVLFLGGFVLAFVFFALAFVHSLIHVGGRMTGWGGVSFLAAIIAVFAGVLGFFMWQRVNKLKEARQKAWKEAHSTPFHLAEAIMGRPFGPRCYSDDAVSLLHELVFGGEDPGIGPYSMKDLDQAIDRVYVNHANDGAAGFKEICGLGDLESRGGKFHWSNDVWQENFTYWQEVEPVESWEPDEGGSPVGSVRPTMA